MARAKEDPERITITDADLALFRALDYHSYLPTHYLFRYADGFRKDYIRHQKRLTVLYNGDKDGRFLSRPTKQSEQADARYRHIVYTLADRARAVLVSRDMKAKHGPSRSSSFIHDLMLGCVTSSIELTAAELGVEFIHRDVFLGDAGMSIPVSRLVGFEGESANPKLVPDDVFGLCVPGGRPRYTALEVDRNTESGRSSFARNTLEKKIRRYDEVLRLSLAHELWGIANFGVLFAVTTPSRARQVLGIVEEVVGKHEQRFFAVAVEPCFGTETAYNNVAYENAHWRVPATVLSHFLTEPWLTVAGPKRPV